MRQIHALIHRLHNPDAGILFIRLALAAVFTYHGFEKITDIDTVAGFFAQGGIDWLFGPLFWAYVVGYTEFLGGLALLAGFLVRYAGLLLAITMAIATFFVHWPNGFSLQYGGYEYALTLFLGSLAVVALGAGKYSLARALAKR